MLRMSAAQTLVIVATVWLCGCIGSPRQRNPNIQRRDKLPNKKARKPSLVGTAPVNRFERTRAEQLLLDMPRNSWVDHDRELYKTLGDREASKHAPVYPWFKVDPNAKPKKK